MKKRVEFKNIYEEEIHFIDIVSGITYGGTVVSSNVEENSFRRKFSCISFILLSFLFGYNHTSYSDVLNFSYIQYPNEFFFHQREIASNLPPSFFFLGGIIGILIMINLRKYNFTKALQISCILMTISYGLVLGYPHIGMIYLTRVLLGISSSIISLIVPQELYNFSSNGRFKSFVVSIFPFFYLFGMGSAVALIPFADNNFIAIGTVPLILSILAFASLFISTKLKTVTRSQQEIGLKHFFYDQKYMISGLIISLMFLSSKASGVDFIGFCSTTLFTGEYAYWYSLTPFGVGLMLTLVGSFFPDKFGRKITYVIGLFAIGCAVIDLFIRGTNIISVLIFGVVIYCFCAVVPYIIPNEVVPSKYREIGNELGQIALWICGLLVSLITVFLYKKGSTTIFLFFCTASIFLGFIILIILPETNKKSEFDFVKRWNNFKYFSSKNTGEETISRD